MSNETAPRGQRPAAGYPAVVPYLTVPDAGLLIRFLQSAFGATPRFIMPMPGGKIVHAEMSLGDGMIMISDAVQVPAPPVHLCHYVPDAGAVYQRALACGATNICAPETKEYGDRIAGVKDPAGNTWWICTRVS